MQNELLGWKWWDLFLKLKEIMALSAFSRQLFLRDLQKVQPIFDIEALSVRACVLIFFSESASYTWTLSQLWTDWIENSQSTIIPY